MSNPEIKLVSNQNIDRAKWDQCIADSTFGIVYAASWYLDRICKKWDALISGDYQYVMPLVNNRKYWISYVYQPFFTQQLGVFSRLEIKPEIINRFLAAIPEQYRLTDMNLNLGNTIHKVNFGFKHHTTYHLSLVSGIDKIRTNYNSNTKRNIQKAIRNKITISTVNDVDRFMHFTKANLKEKSPEIRPNHYLALQKIIRYALDHQLGEIYGAWDSNQNLVASVFFLNSNQNCIYLAATSNQTGIEQCAMFLLIDTFIENNSGKKQILDFEGSDISGVARFYAGFGATPKIYYSIHQNQLPKLLRIFKK